METSYTLSCLKSFKSIILFIFLLFIFSKTHLCHGTVSQNKTLSEINFYNFTQGYYNIVKYSENDDSNFRTIYETEVPYLNITFNAPSDGYLDIYLTPLEGPVPYINLDQEWLNGYELEPYLLFKANKLSYRVKEVSVTKIYPPKELGYTKMRPFIGWWSILKPLVYLGLGIKK